jgi:segregation and condensation protein B
MDSKRLVEAIIFAAGNRISQKRVAELSGLTEKQTEKILIELQKQYDSSDSTFRITHMGEDWKFTVRDEYLAVVEKIAPDTELSRAVVETLAILAWKAPLMQSDLIKVRGSSSYDHIGELQDRGFIAKEKEGRSYIIKLTPKFYEYFDVQKERIEQMFKNYDGQENVKDEQVDEFVKKQEERRERELEELSQKPTLQQIKSDERASQDEFFTNLEKQLSDATQRSRKVIGELNEIKANSVVPADSNLGEIKTTQEDSKTKSQDDDDELDYSTEKVRR